VLTQGCHGVQHARSSSGATITRAMVRAIAPGMTEPEVRAILGPPASIDGPGHAGWGKTFQYGGARPLASAYTVLWVHFTSDGRVREIYAKLYPTSPLADEWGVYSFGAEKRWEGAHFARAFPAP
jgi:outer membrane protein assembly factor BamE (lipoprotein component of BamABCDE complex)